MVIGDKVRVCSEGKPDIIGTIVQDRVPSGIDSRNAYSVSIESDRMNGIALFYMANDIGTRRHYHVGNRAYWIESTD